MKKLTLIATTALVITSLGTFVSPSKASCVTDLDTGIETLSNDGIPRNVLIRNGYTINMHMMHCDYPIDEYEVKGRFQREGGLFSIKLLALGATKNNRVFATYSPTYSLIKNSNWIMDISGGPGAYEHWTSPKRVASDKVMNAIRAEKDRGLDKVELTQESLDNRQGR